MNENPYKSPSLDLGGPPSAPTRYTEVADGIRAVALSIPAVLMILAAGYAVVAGVTTIVRLLD